MNLTIIGSGYVGLIGSDKRIGRAFLDAGLGYGGSCFPKDISAFIAIAESLGTPFNLLKEVQRINAHQLDRLLSAVREALWLLKDKRIAVWGIAFKPNTDDVRSSVAVALIEKLAAEGAQVHAFDPKAQEKARQLSLGASVTLATSALEAARGTDALILATEWPEFSVVDFSELHQLMRTPLILDGRNALDPAVMQALGFQYRGMGLGTASLPACSAPSFD